MLLENTFTSIPDIARLLFPFRWVAAIGGVILVTNKLHLIMLHKL